MKDKYSLISDDDLKLFESMHKKKQSDWYVDQFHLSSYSGLVNDPNGLVKWNDTYYIFYQNAVFSEEHKNKSWSLFTTKDFLNYNSEGIILTPSVEYDKNGVFSGGAYVNEKNELELFYTGNVKNQDNSRMSNTLTATIDFKDKIAYKKLLFQTDLEKYTGEFRDPQIISKENNLYMLNGAQTKEKKGILSVYKKINNNWQFFKNIKLDKNCETNSFMVECPNYFKINNKEFILACLEEDKELKNGGHFVQFREIITDNDLNFEFKSKLEYLDYGYDFYAPQIFQNENDRTIMIGWLGNSRSNYKFSEQKTWSNQLTLPRELFIKNDVLHQKPIAELKILREKQLNLIENQLLYENGIVEILLSDLKTKDFIFEITNQNNSHNIFFKKEGNNFYINRNNMEINDDKNLPNEILFNKKEIENLHLLVDRSSIEIFINDGEFTLTVKFFVKKHSIFKTTLNNVIGYQLKPINIKWNNCIYRNIFVD